MRDDENSSLNRRGFLQTGIATVASAAAVGATASNAVAQDAANNKVKILPRRPLGKTGVDVTILNQGTWRSPDSLDRLLRLGYASGVRYIDTAKSYGSEPGVAKWLQSMPAGTRKEVFLVTKDSPKTPQELITQLDKRCEALKVDYIDLLFIHGIGAGYPVDSTNWPKSK